MPVVNWIVDETVEQIDDEIRSGIGFLFVTLRE
jgi:hypothetical protein